MPAGKLAVTGGFAWAKALHFGVNIRAMRRYSKRKHPALLVDELRECRKALRSAFRKYLIACENYAPTATERRQALNKN